MHWFCQKIIVFISQAPNKTLNWELSVLLGAWISLLYIFRKLQILHKSQFYSNFSLQKFKENSSFKVKNTEITVEKVKELGVKGEGQQGRQGSDRQFSMEVRLTNLPKDLPEL